MATIRVVVLEDLGEHYWDLLIGINEFLRVSVAKRSMRYEEQ
jgi:hypothetical protein